MARTRELGMAWNGTTDTERVNYFFTTTTDHLADAMVFMRDAIVSPLFDEKELEREREVVVGEIERNLSTPSYHFWHELTEHVFCKYPSRKNPLGDEKTVRAATQAKMRTIQGALLRAQQLRARGHRRREGERRLRPGRRALRRLEPGSPTRSSSSRSSSTRRSRSSEVVVVEQPVQTFTGEIVWHGPSTVGKDVDLTYAADLLGTALDEPSSRFQKALVDSGACVHARALLEHAAQRRARSRSASTPRPTRWTPASTPRWPSCRRSRTRATSPTRTSPTRRTRWRSTWRASASGRASYAHSHHLLVDERGARLLPRLRRPREEGDARRHRALPRQLRARQALRLRRHGLARDGGEGPRPSALREARRRADPKAKAAREGRARKGGK